MNLAQYKLMSELHKESFFQGILSKLIMISYFIMLPFIFLVGSTFYQIGRETGNTAKNMEIGQEKQDNTPKKLMYYFPVQPPRVCNYAYEHHDYPAADIFAPIGTPVVAVTDGVIDWLSAEDQYDAKTDRGALKGGISIAIIGTDCVRYYGSHLQGLVPGVEVGMAVYAGQVLGYVGNTGNAKTTPPHLHFGISHPTFAGDWQVRRGEIWPQPYLDQWKKGKMVKPELPE